VHVVFIGSFEKSPKLNIVKISSLERDEMGVGGLSIPWKAAIKSTNPTC